MTSILLEMTNGLNDIIQMLSYLIQIILQDSVNNLTDFTKYKIDQQCIEKSIIDINK